jgi:O-antigen/teichoic acid export membrane protein
MKNQEKIGLILIYIQFILNIVVGFILTPILINAIGIEEYGLYLLVGSLVGYLTIADLGLNSTVVRFVAKYRINKESFSLSKFLGTIFIFYLLILFVLLIIGQIIFNNLSLFINNYFLYENTVNFVFIYLFINAFFSLPLGVFPSIIEGFGYFSITKSVRIIQLSTRALLIAFFLINFSFIGIVEIVLFDTLLSFIFSLYFVLYSFLKLKIHISFNDINFLLIKNVIGFSFFIFILALVNQFFWKIGQIILGLNNSLSEIAVYGIAILLITYVIEITTSISQLLMPRITSYVFPFNKSKLTEIFIIVGKFQFFLLSLIFIGFLILGKDFVFLWLGNDFLKVYEYVLLLIFAISLQSILTVGTSILKAMNLHKFQSIIYLFSSLVFIFLSFILSINFGGYGLIISSIISIFFVQSLLMIFLFKENLKLNIFYILKMIFIPYVLPIILTIIPSFIFNSFFENNWINLILRIFIIAIAYSFFVGLFSINIHERKFLLNKLFNSNIK